MYTRDLDGRLLMPDLPDDRQATIALQHNIQRFRAIFDGVFESLALLKPNGNLIEVNLTAAKSLGIGAEAALRVAKAGAWSWKIDRQQVFWTPEFEILFDYEPGSTQQLYCEWIERVHPEDSLSGRLRQRERVEIHYLNRC